MNALPRPVSRRAARAGFTLLELLTVIVIIGILAGIMFPALGKSRDRAHDLASKDLCAQVAAAWTTLEMNNHRYPSKALLSKYGKDVSSSGGDLVVGMDPGVSSVLNWWTAVTPVPEGDVKNFKPKFRMGSKSGTEVTDFDGADPRAVEAWPVDQLLERSYSQKCFGLYVPWVERKFKELLDAQLTASEDDLSSAQEEIAKSRREWSEKWLVRAVLDMDGDGKVTLPASVASLAGLDDAELAASAAAWVYSKDGRRLLTSW